MSGVSFVACNVCITGLFPQFPLIFSLHSHNSLLQESPGKPSLQGKVLSAITVSPTLDLAPELLLFAIYPDWYTTNGDEATLLGLELLARSTVGTSSPIFP